MAQSVLFTSAVLLVLAVAVPAGAADPSAHAEHFKKCAKVCADCQIECDTCFVHCGKLVAEGKKEHTKSAQLCVDCAECCKMCAALCGRSSPLAAHALECCAKCCEQCAAACEQFPNDEHMARCAKVCRECAKECREMLKHASAAK